MICNQQIINCCSDTSGFSTVCTLSKSENDKIVRKVSEIKSISSSSKSDQKHSHLKGHYFPKYGLGKGSSSTKYTFESEISTNYKRKNSSFSSTASEDNKITPQSTIKRSNYISTCKIGDLRNKSKRNKLPFVKSIKQSDEGENTALSISTDSNSSNGSFLSNNSQRRNDKFQCIKDNITEYSKPLRLFDKSGKPLTDLSGRPLMNIQGEQLVIFDEKGKVISDSKGNQVFNSLGESAIYSTTNLYIPPSEHEPLISLLDVHEKHVLFLYDSKGHPLTDRSGRPLLCASGNPMLGMRSKGNVNIVDYEHFKLKNMYSRSPMENCFRYVKIFDSERKPLTDNCGRLLDGAVVICNKNGMPMCDRKSRPVYFKYGSRISTSKRESTKAKEVEGIQNSELKMLQTSQYSLADKICKDRVKLEEFGDKENMEVFLNGNERCISDGAINYAGKNSTPVSNVSNDDITTDTKLSHLFNDIKATHVYEADKNVVDQNITQEQENNIVDADEKIINQSKKNGNLTLFRDDSKLQNCVVNQKRISPSLNVKKNLPENEKNVRLDHKAISTGNRRPTKTTALFHATDIMDNQKGSSVEVAHFKAIKRRQKSHKRKRKFSLNFFQLFKDVLSKPSGKGNSEQYEYNDYGKPLKDIHGNLLYDKYGIPLTGAQGRRLSEAARQALRCKLRNVPKTKVNITGEGICPPLSRYESHDQFGEPVYDKYGRPLYDLSGRLIYDRFGRPLTDAFGRPLVDAIGQPLMDCEGRVLTSAFDSDSNLKLTDIFGRKIYDTHGRILFDSYGRPKYDVFTNAIYDSCGRPATDANGNVLFDFLNKPIEPYPKKPLYRDARARLPRYIDTVLAVPSMNRLLKYSKLEDVFGGPLFDDMGRPLYNKIGKPLFDRYGRPLYDKNGRPLCDCYGRPLSEEIKQDDDDETLSVVDCLKLLKLNEASMSIWFSKVSKFTKNDQSQRSVPMKILCKNKSVKRRSGRYIYMLTRVTRFASGRQALEILETPLSPSTEAELNRFPLDNKPLEIVFSQQHEQTIEQQQ